MGVCRGHSGMASGAGPCTLLVPLSARVLWRQRGRPLLTLLVSLFLLSCLFRFFLSLLFRLAFGLYMSLFFLLFLSGPGIGLLPGRNGPFLGDQTVRLPPPPPHRLPLPAQVAGRSPPRGDRHYHMAPNHPIRQRGPFSKRAIARFSRRPARSSRRGQSLDLPPKRSLQTATAGICPLFGVSENKICHGKSMRPSFVDFTRPKGFLKWI